MIKSSYITEKFDLKLEKPEKGKFISYSQFSTWSKCPLQWKIKNIDKVKEFTPGIAMTFGTAMHNCVQEWLRIMFTETVKKSNEMDFSVILMNELKNQYAIEVEKYGKHFSNKEELTEYYLDGLETLNYLRKKRTKFFDRRNQELVGTELPLIIEVKPGLFFNAYLDIVIKSKTESKFWIPDLKTSKQGWSQWDKKDEVKIGQLLLYKQFLSKQYNIPIENIQVEFMILKRKIDPDSLYPQKRVQLFKPSQGSISMSKIMRSFEAFINSCFLPNGEYNKLGTFKAMTGKNGFNCRFCDFNLREDLCPKSNRICQ